MMSQILNRKLESSQSSVVCVITDRAKVDHMAYVLVINTYS